MRTLFQRYLNFPSDHQFDAIQPLSFVLLDLFRDPSPFSSITSEQGLSSTILPLYQKHPNQLSLFLSLSLSFLFNIERPLDCPVTHASSIVCKVSFNGDRTASDPSPSIQTDKNKGRKDDSLPAINKPELLFRNA
jgi:hypothetical protein